MHWGHEVSVSRDTKEKVTRAEYNAAAGVDTPEMPDIPECAIHVWQWWWELNARRPPGFEALAPISFSEISAWIMLTGRLVSPEEIRWLIQMDNAWLEVIASERAAKRERDEEKAELEKARKGR